MLSLILLAFCLVRNWKTNIWEKHGKVSPLEMVVTLQCPGNQSILSKYARVSEKLTFYSFMNLIKRSTFLKCRWNSFHIPSDVTNVWV